MKPEESSSEVSALSRQQPQTIPQNRSTKSTNANRHGKDFYRRYLALCRAKNFPPLTELSRVHGAKSRSNQLAPAVLDFYGDRFKDTDWQLVVAALLEDTSLEMVAVRLRKALGDVLENSGSCQQRLDMGMERPVVLTKRLFTRLVDGLAQFLVVNGKVRIFVLEGLPIQGLHMATLVNSLQQNNSITELSFARSAIMDDGAEAVCGAVMHLANVETLNLSGCQLTGRGFLAVAELIKFQKIQRFAESWKYSLRYGEVDPSKMQGLRHVLLNANPRAGDDGLQELTEVLKEDEWIQQVHVRNCGLTDEGVKFLVDCLNVNKSIEKFDIRDNAAVSEDACREFLIKLGVELESSDSGLSLKDSSMEGSTKMKQSEQIKYLQQQLSAERHRSSQLQLMIEQLHLQQTEYATEMSALRKDYNRIVEEREKLLKRVQNLQKQKPSSRASNLPKSKSDLPSVLFGRVGSPRKRGSKSEMTLRWVRERHVTNRRAPLLESKPIGDGERVDPIAELSKQLNVAHKQFGGQGGDAGLGCSKVDSWNVGEDRYEDFDGVEDRRLAGARNSCEDDYEEGDDEEFDESISSISGAELLQMLAKKRQMIQGNSFE